ncbi:metallophosphoesterase [Desulfobacterales bacterium HSG2]|nr:metallophosphoesterase [Desulfobacterales bacterium HSG2]
MHFFLKVFIFLVFIQIMGFVIWWRRLNQRPRFRPALIGLFLAGNLPWPFFYFAFTRPDPPSTWITSFILRLFTTWQVGLLLWLYFAAIIALIVIVFYRIPRTAVRAFRQKEIPSMFADDEKEITDRQKDVPAAFGGNEKKDERKPLGVNRREFLVRTTCKAVWGTTVACAAYGFVRSEFEPRVVTHNLPLAGLPDALDGLTIAHLSDLHVGVWTSPNDMPQMMALTRDLRPDMVVITGDIIDHNPSFSQALLRHLHYLDRVPLGVYAVIGNHDIYTGAQQVSEALRSGKIVVLRDTHCSLENQGLPLALIGVDDPGRRWFGSGGHLNLDRAMKNLSYDLFPILLVHRPTGFDAARTREIPVTLCGHTHGGQFALPGGPNLADIAYKYTHGLYKRGDSLLHVSAGTGAVGLPFRIGVPAEIALLRLSTIKNC